MPKIEVLDQQTIDKIAAGEVIERPASVVKELVENAIDAGASAVTVEIKEGGTSLIRITDNGCGIEAAQVPLAFLRHSTSKIRQVEDLFTVSSLGFRGEALSSIAAVSRVELITKSMQELSGVRYVIEGGREQSQEEIGAPEGTTFLVHNLFFNTPARRKFLKTAQTEAGYVSDLMNHMALSHPEISFKLIVNRQVKLYTSGNSNLGEVIYHIYGRELAANLLPIACRTDDFSITGFLGKPLISRGNRNFEHYFINGRYVKSSLIAKSIEDGYRSFVMQHKYPFTVLQISIRGELLDVNVHPAKMELRFSNQEALYETLKQAIQETINRSELIYAVNLGEEKKNPPVKAVAEAAKKIPEPFETNRLDAVRKAVQKDSPYEPKYDKARQEERTSYRQAHLADLVVKEDGKWDVEDGRAAANASHSERIPAEKNAQAKVTASESEKPSQPPKQAAQQDSQQQTQQAAQSNQSARQEPHQQTMQAEQSTAQSARQDLQPPAQTHRRLLAPESLQYHKILGQLFDTYWLVQMDDTLYIIDQHAAHEKVLYERMMASLKTREYTSQVIFPPILLSLSMQEEELLKKYESYFTTIGYVIEHFGGKEYAVTSVPANLPGINEQTLILEMLDGLQAQKGHQTPEQILERIASMSCKAAVKGNQRLSRAETEALIEELLTLQNPYHCPHGRPTIISMTKYELEKKFKRVL